MIYMFLQKKEKRKKKIDEANKNLIMLTERLAVLDKKLDCIAETLTELKSTIGAVGDEKSEPEQEQKRTISETTLEAAKADRTMFNNIIDEWLNGKEDDNGKN